MTMDLKTKLNRIPFRKVCMVIGAIMIFLPTNISALWGNISVYVASYFFLENGSTAYFQSSWMVSLCTSATVGGNLISDRLTCWNRTLRLLIGIIVSSLCHVVCYFASTYLAAPVIYVAMCVNAICYGLISVAVMKQIKDNADNDTGRMISMAYSGTALGTFLFNPMTNLYVNPVNLEPDFSVEGMRLFSQMNVTEKVPGMFLLLGAVSLLCGLGGYVLFMQMKPTKQTGCNGGESAEQRDGYGTLDSQLERVTEVVNLEFPGSENHEPQNISINEYEETALPTATNSTTICADKTPRQLICSGTFHILCFATACQVFTKLLLTNYFKSYGFVNIHDDRFLSVIGASIGIISAAMMFVWGIVLDKINIKTSLIILYGSIATFSLLMYFTPMVNKWLYFISVDMLAATINCKYPTFVTLCMEFFGSKHFSSNFGLLNAARMVTGFAAPPVLNTLLEKFNWFSIFCCTASLSLIDLILIVLFVPRG